MTAPNPFSEFFLHGCQIKQGGHCSFINQNKIVVNLRGAEVSVINQLGRLSCGPLVVLHNLYSDVR